MTMVGHDRSRSLALAFVGISLSLIACAARTPMVADSTALSSGKAGPRFVSATELAAVVMSRTDGKEACVDDSGRQVSGCGWLYSKRPTFNTERRTESADAIAKATRAAALPYDYVVGGCQNRAHALSLLLTAAGFDVYKVWAIAPSKHSTVIAEDFVRPIGIPGNDATVNWKYHVALAFRSEAGELIVDPALSVRPLPTNDWLAAFGCKDATCVVTATDARWQTFTTWSAVMQPPPWVKTLPDVWNGGFYHCAGDCLGKGWVELDLAVNTAAGFLLRKVGSMDGGAAREEVATLLATMDNLTAVLNGGTQTTNAVLLEAKRVYEQSLTTWKSKLAEVRRKTPWD